MTTQLPHDPYIDAVLNALTTAGLEPDDSWTGEDEVDRYDTGLDAGCTTMLDAHLVWMESSAHPHGIHLVWEHPAEQWQWAPRKADGSLERDLEFLPMLGRWSAPAAIVPVVRALLAGERLPEGHAPYWHEADAVRRAVTEWAGRTS
ncbi:hypothetical protein ACH49_13565 [Streptomyces leeuwenhoekii]|uniref:Uncharacterized protein n=1 Tax=Streptomyces leeuwenhoekii TaxID=1437453 RepID=A0ABR5HZA2_STRLW|nr:hypothetical protein [Streptomyces leeuwenhoekii]KMS79080.1 hypothetical protein ACH49_13565 [Streptomyces leeuwenhoekii]